LLHIGNNMQSSRRAEQNDLMDSAEAP